MKRIGQTKPGHNKVEPRDHATRAVGSKRPHCVSRLTRLICSLILILSFALPVLGQSNEAEQTEVGSIVGTVTDVNGDTISGATVTVSDSLTGAVQSFNTGDSGFFQFRVRAHRTYNIAINADGFADWKSPAVAIEPGEYKILTDCTLRLNQVVSRVDVAYDAETVALEQIKFEEKQRVLGIVPNFYVVYDEKPEPLTTKLKFRLALKVASDPVTAIGIGILSGAQQAGNTPDYQLGAKGYGQRFGANATDGFTNIMIGGAILPSLLHQDPRYFYQGKGTGKSRALHAIAHPFVCKGDNGRWQPNYSSMGGDLFSSALSNAYYPKSNRGVGLVFGNFAISTAERIASALAQEFILGKFTSRSKVSK